MPQASLLPGSVVWVQPEVVVGREQGGRRPALVISGDGYLDLVDTLVIVAPLTTTDRGWSNHVEVRGSELGTRSWAMSEQVRTISRERIVDHAGRASPLTLARVRSWLADFLEL